MLKKVFYLFTLICFIFSFSIASAEGINYTNSDGHYSMDMPDGWSEIPGENLDEYSSAVSQISGQAMKYEAGFQWSERDYFEHPYVLIQKYDVDTPSYSQLLKSFTESAMDEASEEIEESTDLIENASIDKPYVDKERNILFMNITMDVAGVGTVRGLSALFLGKQRVTQVSFYALDNENDQFMPAFESMIDSFKYDAGFEYNLEEAEKNDSSVWKGVLGKAIIGAVVGAIIGVIAAVISKKKKGGKKGSSQSPEAPSEPPKNKTE